jgi:hypothetical protein
LSRAGNASITAARWASVIENQPPISANVRPQPLHKPLAGS